MALPCEPGDQPLEEQSAHEDCIQRYLRIVDRIMAEAAAARPDSSRPKASAASAGTRR